MDIDFIIPAKSASERVPGKNWRPFHGADSLVDLTIRKLLKADASADRIHVSCESKAAALPTCEKWGVKFLPRDVSLCGNNVPLTTWMRTICGQVPGDNPIGWAQVCDPMFDEYRQCLDRWRGMTGKDSLVVCRPWSGYLMTSRCQPIGWSFGEHHTPSQQLPLHFLMPFTFSILTREAIAATGYHVGRRPYWYTAQGPFVDIDTEWDFEVARVMYEHNKRKS